MKKFLVVGSIILVIFAVALGVVLSFFKIAAYFGRPIELKDKLDEQQFDVSYTLQNHSDRVISVGGLELMADAEITMRSTMKWVFITWHGIHKNGVPLAPSGSLTLANSPYGKYSTELTRTSWAKLINSPIAEQSCSQYAVEWLNPMPMAGLSLEVRDENTGSLYQIAYYSKSAANDMYQIELSENFNRYSSRGSHFHNRYHCQTTGSDDRLGQFVLMVNQLTQ